MPMVINSRDVRGRKRLNLNIMSNPMTCANGFTRFHTHFSIGLANLLITKSNNQPIHASSSLLNMTIVLY